MRSLLGPTRKVRASQSQSGAPGASGPSIRWIGSSASRGGSGARPSARRLTGVEPGLAGRMSPALSRVSDDRLPSTSGVSQPPLTARYVRAPIGVPPRMSRSPSARGKLEGRVQGRFRPSRPWIAASIGAPASARASGARASKAPPINVSSTTPQSSGLPTSAFASAAEPWSKAPPTGTPHSR